MPSTRSDGRGKAVVVAFDIQARRLRLLLFILPRANQFV